MLYRCLRNYTRRCIFDRVRTYITCNLLCLEWELTKPQKYNPNDNRFFLTFLFFFFYSFSLQPCVCRYKCAVYQSFERVHTRDNCSCRVCPKRIHLLAWGLIWMRIGFWIISISLVHFIIYSNIVSKRRATIQLFVKKFWQTKIT